MAEPRESWEQRAYAHGNHLSGVLFRGLSDEANAVIDDWHAWVVREVFLPTIPVSGSVLDLGCGYGRLSDVIAESRPDVHVVGQDLAYAYCRQYQRSDRFCVQGDATQPPFSPATFDGILAVTCLMYAPRARVPDVLRQLGSLLRARGSMLLLDPGAEMQRLVTRVRGARASSPTGGHGFDRGEYRQLAERAGLRLIGKGGNLWTSLALAAPGMASSGPGMHRVLERIGRLDHRKAGYQSLALHRWLLAARVDQTDAETTN